MNSDTELDDSNWETTDVLTALIDILPLVVFWVIPPRLGPMLTLPSTVRRVSPLGNIYVIRDSEDTPYPLDT